MKAKLLFIGEAVTFAHVTRPWSLQRSLDRTVYEIHFACAETFGLELFQLQKEALFFHKIHSHSPQKFHQILKEGKVLYDEQTLAEYVHEDCQLLARVKPDIVIGDFRISLAVSAAIAKVPYVAITNAYWSPFRMYREMPIPSFPIFSKLGFTTQEEKWRGKLGRKLYNAILPKILSQQLRGLNEVRMKHGLSPFESYFHGFTAGDYTLYADIPSLVPTSNLPSYHRYLGPISYFPHSPSPLWWKELNPMVPKIYLSLGSSGDLSVLPKIVSVLKELPIEVICSTAGRLGQGAFPKNFYVADFLNGDEAAKIADVVICNGGSPAAYQALRSGKPVLGIPANMDQLLSMTYVDRYGGGILLRADTLEVRSFRQALTRLLNENIFTLKAQVLSTDLQVYQSESIFQKLIEEIIEGSKTIKVAHQ